jgi:DNA-binding NarL/FixJ family response regulator
VILDLMMPEKDGLETISILRSIAPDTKIIVYTAFGRYESSLYAKEADKFLLKTESPERVLKSIKDLIE